jgi:hypothetical protein
VPLYLKRPWERLKLTAPPVRAFRQTLRIGKGQATRWNSASKWNRSASCRPGNSMPAT